MAETEPASDERRDLAQWRADRGMDISAQLALEVLARLRKAEKERDEAVNLLKSARESFEAVKDFASSDYVHSCVVLSAIADIDEHIAKGGGA